MSNILYREEIIRKYKENLGIDINYHSMFKDYDVPVFNQEDKISKSINHRLEKIPKFYREQDDNFLAEKLTSNEEQYYAEILYNILSDTIKDFITDSLVVGKKVVNEIGIIDIFKSNSFLFYDFICEDSIELFNSLKKNIKKLEHLFGNQTDYDTVKLTNNYNRVQIFLTDRVKKSVGLDVYKNYLLNKKDKKDVVSLGFDKLSNELIIKDLNDVNSVGIFGGEGFGKTNRALELINNIKLLNPKANISTMTFSMHSLGIDDFDNSIYEYTYTDINNKLDSILEHIKNEKEMFKDENLKDFSEYYEKYPYYLRTIIFIDDLTQMNFSIDIDVKELRDKLIKLSKEIKGTSYTLIYCGQRIIDSSVPKLVVQNTDYIMISPQSIDCKLMLGHNYIKPNLEYFEMYDFYLSNNAIYKRQDNLSIQTITYPY